MEIIFTHAYNEKSSLWNIEATAYNGKIIETIWDVLEELEKFSGLKFSVKNSVFLNQIFVAMTRDKINLILTKLKTEKGFMDKASLSKALRKINTPA